jgi:hypothetical protein
LEQEEDWNTNLPYTCDAEEIYSHIEHNKQDDTISKEDCIKAIKMLQEVIAEERTGTIALPQEVVKEEVIRIN